MRSRWLVAVLAALEWLAVGTLPAQDATTMSDREACQTIKKMLPLVAERNDFVFSGEER